MRRILITPRIERIAEDYRNNIFKGRQRNFERPEQLLQKLLDDINAKKCRGYKNWHVYAKYLQNIISHYNELLDLKPGQFDDYHMRYFNVSKAFLTDKTWRNNSGRTSFSDVVVKKMRYEDVRQKEILPYLEQLGVYTCVYCNSQYTPTIHIAKGHLKGGFELDHNRPKSEFPFLCTSFFNLYPVCSNCNGWKLDRKAEFVLYTENYKELDPFYFSLDKASIIKYMLYHDSAVLDIVFDSKDLVLLTNHNKLFHIDKYYKAFRDVAEELVWKSKTRNNIYQKQMIKSFQKLFPRKKADIIRFLYGLYPLTQDIYRRPLTKLQQDLAKQLKII